METQKTLFGKQTNKDVAISLAGSKANERIISYYNHLIGSLRGTSRPEILPFGENAEEICRVHENKEVGDRQKKVNYDILKMTALKRTHDTPKEINDFLKEHKKDFTIQQIADKMELPKTQVAHYFRSDNSRAIPSPEDWIKLKNLLGFDDIYDKQVTEIYEKEIEFEQTRRVYYSDGVSPTLSSSTEPMFANKRIMFDLYNQNLRDECPTLLEPHHNSIKVVENFKDKNNVMNVLTLERKDWREHQEEGIIPTLKQRMGTGGNNIPMVFSLAGDRDNPSLTIKDICGTISNNSMSDRQPFILRGRPRYDENGKRNLKIFDYTICPTLTENCAVGDQKNVIANKPMISSASPREIKFQDFCPALLSRDYKDPKVVQVHSLYPRSGNPKQGGTGHLKKEEGEEMFTLTGQDIHGVNYNNRLRRLTPKECERLQGFPERESFINFKIHKESICIDLQKSYVNVEIKNPKLQKYVGNVERIGLKENAQYVKNSLNIKNQQIKRPVQENVLISCEEGKIQLNNQKKSFSFVDYATNQNSFLPHIKEDLFAQLLVGINTTLKNVIKAGKEELVQKEQSLIQVENGKIYVNLCGGGMMQSVKDVKKDLTILKKHLNYIISNHLNLKNIEQEWIISFYYVISAIIGYIQIETKINNSLNLDVYFREGHTYGVSNTQRYKQMGNAVTTKVITAITKKIGDL